MPSDATTPNSISRLLDVMINVAKPQAVVRLVTNDAFPILHIVRCNAITLRPCNLYSAWYLLNIYIMFGMPITISSGGIIDVRMVTWYPSSTI